ncbi:hypothetical protein CPB83DRAFT_568517 [Crepidotus variabilis]|uniref:Transmembrane protein n=1 Tax=Crepidotus variabilis TaxID=179855 RepID=A0A9P6E9T3_9AGAR|nr:hypothetical protein CPB83DRAFT_568517 [Crepidotus variabilis]
MVNWESTDRPLDAFTKILVVLSGLYAWELLLSIDLEWRLITRRKEFTWPLVLYFANRYCTLGALIATFICFNANLTNCQRAFAATLFLAHLSITFASLNLATRTIAIWGQDRFVTGALCLLMIGHFCLIVVQASSAVISKQEGIGCIPSTRNYAWDAAFFLYAFLFDLVVLALNTFKLRGILSPKAVMNPSSFTMVIFNQGIVYFIIACLVNLIAFVFLVLDNIGSIATSTICASVCCTIVACRSVRSLAESNGKPEWLLDPQIQPTTGSWRHPYQVESPC